MMISAIEMLLMTLFSGLGGNQLVDFVDADVYFEAKKVEVTVENMMLEAKTPKLWLE